MACVLDALGGGDSLPSASPIDVVDLARIEDRISFLYFERCVVNQAENAITVATEEGIIRVPTASLGVLLLGPGSTISHRAVALLGECGVTVVWVGERGVRMYAAGKPLTHSSALLQKQAKLVSNNRKRLAVARLMYGMRFPGEDVSKLTMQQLRGREGVRVRRVYRKLSKETGVPWDKRTFNPEDFHDGSDINQALSAANVCLYGIVHAVITAMGCSPGLGFVHIGHELSFVYDIADLYKAGLSIPVAFRTVAEHPDNVGQATRRAMRDAMYDLSLVKRIVSDVHLLLLFDEKSAIQGSDADMSLDKVALWDEFSGEVAAGRAYGLDADLAELEAMSAGVEA